MRRVFTKGSLLGCFVSTFYMFTNPFYGAIEMIDSETRIGEGIKTLIIKALVALAFMYWIEWILGIFLMPTWWSCVWFLAFPIAGFLANNAVFLNYSSRKWYMYEEWVSLALILSLRLVFLYKLFSRIECLCQMIYVLCCPTSHAWLRT